MAETLRGGLSLTMSGFAFTSHDIGGFEVCKYIFTLFDLFSFITLRVALLLRFISDGWLMVYSHLIRVYMDHTPTVYHGSMVKRPLSAWRNSWT